jgi:transposase InsO family protein
MLWKTIKELFKDLGDYYVNPYPILLVVGALRRFWRRCKIIWIPKGRGRPSISEEVINLILDMKRSNQGWGALRISQELAFLGIKVSKTTIASILKQNGFVPPPLRMSPISWEAFFNYHKHLWAMDFHSVYDIKGNQIFVLVILDVITRELVSINSTLNPNRNWIIQQFCNAEISGYKHPSGLIADNDGIYGGWLDCTLKKLFNIDVHHIPIKMPWKNGRCERLHLTIKTEITNRVDIRDVAQLQELCVLYQDYYNSSRPHQALDGKTPENKILNKKKTVKTVNFSYVKKPLVGGLVTKFSIAA